MLVCVILWHLKSSTHTAKRTETGVEDTHTHTHTHSCPAHMQSEEDKAKFDEVTQGYKILSDPEKKKKWLNHENVDDKGIPSDTQTLTGLFLSLSLVLSLHPSYT